MTYTKKTTRLYLPRGEHGTHVKIHATPGWAEKHGFLKPDSPQLDLEILNN